MSKDQDDNKKFMNKKGSKHVINYEINPSSQLLFEEKLKQCINKFSGKSKDDLRSKYAPRNKHSPFGDFPPGYIPSKTTDFSLINIESHQVANAVTNGFNSKSNTNKGGKPFTKTIAFSSLKKPATENPPKAGALNQRAIPVSDFRLHYDRGDLPILVQHEKGTKIKWKNETFDDFNFQLFLPIFIDGIREKTDPYRFLSIQGTFDLLTAVKDNIVKIIPQLVLPLKAALNTRDVDVIAVALKVNYFYLYLGHSKTCNKL